MRPRYSEPSDYIPKAIRKERKLGEYAEETPKTVKKPAASAGSTKTKKK